jgi:23S rRNA (adenine2503-C2)-methyltransferase
MGEPFLNYNNLDMAIRILHERYPNAQLLVSTSAPTSMKNHFDEFIALSKEIDKVGLQFSVHESLDENRRKLIPTNTSTLQEISEYGELWASQVGRKVFYNYCVHPGNDSEEDADRLIKMFIPACWETTLSVICEKSESVKSSIERQLEIINTFAGYLTQKGASLRIFNPAGQDDIGGGCGQLWFFQEWLKKRNNN